MRIFSKVVLIILLCLYLSILTKLILFKHLPLEIIISNFTFKSNDDFSWYYTSNFIPFKTIIYYLFLADINLNIRIENLGGNVIGFAPFGFIIPLLSKKFLSFKNVAIATACLSLLFELTQLIFKFGSFDVDDLILNTLGGMLGYVPIKLIRLLINQKQTYSAKDAL
ncbi:VanZ family protein [Neobacillus sp. NPDC058068]|uniref:VanZ family protein n=1 Tax=Neobacillus sp. NPDC058068 TaxID=3346325 RepID=UPI0036D76A50